MGALAGRLGSTATMPRVFYRQRIIEDIRAGISSGQLKPGDKLPTQAQLAAQYGCSETPVKQALAILEALGLVEGHQGKGTFVTGGRQPDI